MLYCMTAEMSQQLARGLIENPEDRERAAGQAIEACGGRLVSWYVMMGGPKEVLAIYDVPDGQASMALTLIAEASGGLRNIRTRRLFGSQELTAAAKQAQGAASVYKLPGQR
jgi:uncharacterized protein with GYD domain